MKAALLGLYLLSPLAGTGGDWTHVYDQRFRDAALHHWAQERHIYWPLLKAQAACESSLRPDVVSPAGAAGISQFVPGTWQDVVAREGWEEYAPTPFDADWAIQAQASQMEWLVVKIWTAPRPVDLEMEIALASYNAGQGSIIQAQRLANGARDWVDIAPHLIDVTGPDHSAETVGYLKCAAERWQEITRLPWSPWRVNE